MKRVIQCAATLALLSFSLAAFADSEVNNTAVNVTWGYKGDIGPERWAQLDPSFALCATGKMQSPINLTKDFHKADNKLSLDYRPAPLEIINDGTTDLTLGKQKIIVNDGHGIQLNFHHNHPKETITFEGETYELIQFHFHSPSENRWHGQSFPMEIHFVHQGKDGKVAVIGVFVKAGAESATIGQIINHLPADHGKEHVIEGEKINPIDLFPASKNYFRFAGSLTTPPCTENVQWVVMAAPIEASPGQIVLLRQAVGGNNARSVQPSNKRGISFSEHKRLRTRT